MASGHCWNCGEEEDGENLITVEIEGETEVVFLCSECAKNYNDDLHKMV